MPVFNSQLFNSGLFGGPVNPGGIIIEVGSGILYPALRKAGVTLAPGRTPSSAQFQDAIDELNRLVGSLNCDRLFIYSRTNYIFPLTGAKTYTIGQDPTGVSPIADFDVPRPQLIEEANIIILPSSPGGTRRPLFLATDQQWAKIAVQDIPNAVPQVLYNDRAYPISTLSLWGQPVPGYELELFVWTQIPVFFALTDVASVPMQYVDAMVLNLAVRLVTLFPLNPTMPRQVDPNLYQQARESLMRLESINAPQPIAALPLCGDDRNRYNIYNDTWGR